MIPIVAIDRGRSACVHADPTNMRIRFSTLLASIPMMAVAVIAFALPHVDPIAENASFVCYVTGGITLAMGLGFLAAGVGILPERRRRE